MAARAHSKTETVAADAHTAVNNHVVANNGMQYSSTGTDRRASTNLNPRTDDRPGADKTVFAHLGIRSHDRTMFDRNIVFQLSRVINIGARCYP